MTTGEARSVEGAQPGPCWKCGAEAGSRHWRLVPDDDPSDGFECDMCLPCLTVMTRMCSAKGVVKEGT